MNNHRSVLLVASTLLIVGLSYAGRAHAAWQQWHSSTCERRNDAGGETFDESGEGRFDGGNYMCQLPDTSTNGKDDITSVAVYTTDNGVGSVSASVCVTRATSGVAGSCDSANNNTLGGDREILLSGAEIDLLDSGADRFAFLFVTVVAGGQNFRGYFVGW